MTSEERFNRRKDDLLSIVKNRLATPDLSDTERTSLNQLIKVMNEYTFANRLEIKGFLSHVIVDSLTVDYSVGDKFIEFDNHIK